MTLAHPFYGPGPVPCPECGMLILPFPDGYIECPHCGYWRK
jgi:DNA-directed RNA polymerase subunit RPC12/RpoP